MQGYSPIRPSRRPSWDFLLDLVEDVKTKVVARVHEPDVLLFPLASSIDPVHRFPRQVQISQGRIILPSKCLRIELWDDASAPFQRPCQEDNSWRHTVLLCYCAYLHSLI